MWYWHEKYRVWPNTWGGVRAVEWGGSTVRWSGLNFEVVSGG